MAAWKDPDKSKYDWGMLGSGASGIGSGLMGLFGSGGNSPGNAANQYLNQIPGQTGQYFDPYINAGRDQLPGLSSQYGQLMNDPGGRLNQIGEGYHQSPGFKFALEQALGGANRSAAAGGMVGSPASQQQNMGIATGLADQDYNQWLEHATGLYDKGLQGGQGLANMGLQAGSQQANMIAQMLAQQAQTAQQEQQRKNESRGSAFGNLAGGLGSLAGGLFGGPFGAAAGGSAARWAGNKF